MSVEWLGCKKICGDVFPGTPPAAAQETSTMARRSAWQDSFYLLAYELARAGLEDKRIAQALGVDHHTLAAWVKARPALREALAKGRNKAVNFRDHVRGWLPPELRQLWDTLDQFDSAEDGPALAAALLEGQGAKARKHLFAYALVACNFNVSAASRKVGISHNLYYEWLRSDEEFRELIREIRSQVRDFFEAALVELVGRGIPSVVIFANKTFNRDRGYGDKPPEPPEGPRADPGVLDLASLDLSPEVQAALLEAIRRHERGQAAGALAEAGPPVA
jgi:hypothetical protein